MKKLLLFLVIIIFCMEINAQNVSPKEKTKLLGITTSLLFNHSFIDYYNGENIKNYKHKLGLGNSTGFSYIEGGKRLFLEFAFQFSYENMKLYNVPNSTLFLTYLPDSIPYFYDGLDYNNLIAFEMRYLCISAYYKINYHPLVKNRFSWGFGVGIAPSYFIAEQLLNSSGKFKSYKGKKSDFQLWTTISTDLLINVSKKIYLKTAITSSLGLLKRKYWDYNTKIFNTGVEVGIYYKLKS